jgi:MoaA/NifB/PqqE/SkfB family radical SAM enzyme
MVGFSEIARRVRGRRTGRLESLPILALSVHSACNCRCVMCDIWKANADKREISTEDLERHVDAIRALHVQRVMLTGGEPLLHRNLWALCDQLRALGIKITLVTTGLLTERHTADIAAAVDTVVISLDGDRVRHDEIRRVKGGFDQIARGVMALHRERPTLRLIARMVVQRSNYGALAETIAAARSMGFDQLSFLAVDVSSNAFNRATPWSEDRAADVAIPADELLALRAAIAHAVAASPESFENGFVAGGQASLDRIYGYYAALAGERPFPTVSCNAPWISAVLDPGGVLRPCFFQPAYEPSEGDLGDTLNSPSAVAFRRTLNVDRDATCRRCVCSLNLPLSKSV